jgi:hypothetical protein
MTKSPLLLPALLALTIAFAPAALSQTNLAGLGNTNFNILITNSAAVTQTSTNLTFAPQGLGGLFGGSFTNAYNWSAYSDTNVWSFGLFMSVPGVNPNGSFTVELFDALFDPVAKYQGATDTAGAVSSFVSMTRAVGGSGIFTNIGGFQMTWDSEGSANVIVVILQGVTNGFTNCRKCGKMDHCLGRVAMHDLCQG